MEEDLTKLTTLSIGNYYKQIKFYLNFNLNHLNLNTHVIYCLFKIQLIKICLFLENYNFQIKCYNIFGV